MGLGGRGRFTGNGSPHPIVDGIIPFDCLCVPTRHDENVNVAKEYNQSAGKRESKKQTYGNSKYT